MLFRSFPVTIAGGENKKIQSFSQKIDQGLFYLVFFSGNVKLRGDSTQFTEHAKFMINEENLSCTLLNHDENWVIKSSDDIGKFWAKCCNWQKIQLGFAITSALKKHGYKFGNGKKDLYFVPATITDEFYKIKKVINSLGGSLRIAPIICGCMEDAEEYRKIVSEGFENEMLAGKKDLFELCLNIYSQQKDWEEYQKLVETRNIEGMKQSYIGSRTKYGQQLTRKLEIIDKNASECEWEEIVKDWVASVKPVQRVKPERLFAVQKIFKQALAKIQNAGQVRYLESLREDIERDVLITNKILAKVSEQTIDEVLQIL